MNKNANTNILSANQGTWQSQTAARFMIKKVFILLPALLFSATNYANTVYVDDTLRVGVRAKPDKSMPSLIVIKSGESVELIEKKGSYAKVRTNNGIEGWVKSAYLSNNFPAVKKLAQANAQIEALKSKIDTIQSAKQSIAKDEIASLQKKVSTLKNEKQALQNQLSNTTTINLDTSETNTDDNTINRSIAIDFKNFTQDTLYLSLGIIVVILSLGFLFGVSWYKKQVSKRLGGLSI